MCNPIRRNHARLQRELMYARGDYEELQLRYIPGGCVEEGQELSEGERPLAPEEMKALDAARNRMEHARLAEQKAWKAWQENRPK